jgi:hypothetical protein
MAMDHAQIKILALYFFQQTLVFIQKSGQTVRICCDSAFVSSVLLAAARSAWFSDISNLL